MKRGLFLLMLVCAFEASAQNFLISFTGTGASTTVSTVEVENLTAGTSRTLNGDDILRLTTTTGVNSIENGQSSRMNIYPNPMTDKSTLLISAPDAGDAIISVYDITGRRLTQIKSYIENYTQEFAISGLKTGLYFINVKGNSYQFSGKLVSNGKSDEPTSVKKVNANIAVDKKVSMMDTKGVQATIDMEYTTGDRLKFIGISGNYSTVITDIPTEDKTITFNFIACTDGDNNNYPIVEKGTQTWMAENLKTTKYNDGTEIPNITDGTAWGALTTGAYSDYDNIPDNSTTYGRLYNWYAVDNNAGTKVASNGGKNVCPTGWHVPNDAEWTTLTDYLTNNGYGYEGSGTDIAKSMAATSGWQAYGTPGTVGNDQASNNRSGFTALPSGGRYGTGAYNLIEGGGFWWSSSEDSAASAYRRRINYNSGDVNRSYANKQVGFSVRCLRD